MSKEGPRTRRHKGHFTARIIYYPSEYASAGSHYFFFWFLFLRERESWERERGSHLYHEANGLWARRQRIRTTNTCGRTNWARHSDSDHSLFHTDLHPRTQVRAFTLRGAVWLEVRVRKWENKKLVIIFYVTWELVSEFFSIWMLLESVIWKMLCLFRCLDDNEEVEVKKLTTKLTAK